MIKIAFIGKPKLSGDYTHFKYLRDNLPQYNFFLVGLGKMESLDEDDKDFFHVGSHLDRKLNHRELAELFLKFHKENNFNIIIPVDSPIVTSCIPFLENVRIVHVVNLDSNRLYKYVTSYFDNISKIICISPCQINVLKNRLSPQAFQKKVILLPHGVTLNQSINFKEHYLPLTIGYVGRMHHGHKGILWIPKILKKLKIPFNFEVVGEGEDQQRFLNQLKYHQVPFTSYGYVSPEKINEYLHNWDILLFPSQIEGFGLTLIEAMNNGVVPIANHLPGITDYIIDSEKDGFVVKKNRIKEFVSRIHQLNEDRDLLFKMKIAAKEKVKSQFDLKVILDKYVEVFEEVIASHDPGEVKDFSEWEPFVEYKPDLSTKLMNRLRKLQDFLINKLA